MPRLLSAAVKLCVTAFLGVFAASGALAQAPMSKDRSPGWYRMHLGSFEIRALSDGTLDLPVDQLFPKVDPGRIRSLLARSCLAPNMSLTVNAFLVNTGTRLVLIDTSTGTSQMFGPKLGHLLANLRASGYSAEQVEEIYVTHMHTDHIGGLLRDGQPAFPRATIRADVHEAGSYLSKAEMDAVPADERKDYESAMAIFEPYLASGKFKPFDGTCRPADCGGCSHARQGHPPVSARTRAPR